MLMQVEHLRHRALKVLGLYNHAFAHYIVQNAVIAN
jgi:hypothetical protein